MAYYVGDPLSAGLFELTSNGLLVDTNNVGDPSGFLGDAPASAVNAAPFPEPFPQTAGMPSMPALPTMHHFTALGQQHQMMNHSQFHHKHLLSALQPSPDTPASASEAAASPEPTSSSKKSSRRDKKGTKRPRPTLSCTECVRRKSKCDRTIPCATCIKRGTPDRCRVDDDEQRPHQPFAQARDLDNVKDRIARLEALLMSIAPEQAKRYIDLELSGEGGPSTLLHGRDGSSDEEEGNEEGGEAEKAAFALESIAVAGRGSSNLQADGVSHLPEPLALTNQARIREDRLRQQEIDFLMEALPIWSQSRSLVDAFFIKVSWQNHIIHAPTYEAQFAALHELIDQRRMSEIDTAWLSLHFMVLACGLFFSPERTDLSPAQQLEQTNTWVLCSQRALTVADWSGRPQLTCIQAVVLFPMILMHTGGIKRLASWIAAALRMAQLLDLHKIDDRSRMSLPGPSANLTPVEREVGKRVYFALTHGEVNFASRWLGLDQSSSPTHSQVPNLLNVDDADLLVNPPVSKPIEVATASSFQVLRARIMLADISARLTGSDARVHKYETVLSFDQRTRQLLEELPAYFRYNRSDDPEIQAVVANRPYIALQRCVILYGLNNRLLRAHRPFMTRGYVDSKYAYSTASCIKAAKVIIAAQRALREIFPAADRMYNCLLYCFSSAVVLLVDNFHRLSPSEVLSSTEELDAQRHEAYDVLTMVRRESSTSTIAAASAKVLEGLLNEEDQRRQQRGLSAAPEAVTRSNTPDHVGSSLRAVVERIAGSTTALSPPSALTSTSVSPPMTKAPALPNRSIAPKPSGPVFADMLSLPTVDFNPASSPAGFIGLGNTTLTQEESEDLLRSLGFFEVTTGSMPSVSGGNSIHGSSFANTSMTQDLGWLDGLGEW